jgi:3-oxoacyl-[acyl-carrier protein] reductase
MKKSAGQAKIALITGSSRNIGKSIAFSLAKDGYDIILNCRKITAEANQTKKQIQKTDRKVWLITGDVGKESEMKIMFKRIAKLITKIDVLVNNAGFDYGYSIENYSIKQVQQVLQTNLLGTIIVTKYALPLLKKSQNPVIINISSRCGGPTTIDGIGAYGPAKAGVIKFTQCCAREFAPYKIRVNCVAPGFTDTQLNRAILPDQTFWQQQAQRNPRQRVGQPQDTAHVVAFLASNKADYVNGQTIYVTGGSEFV